MKKKRRGRPFKKNDPRINPGPGRPKKSVTWKKAEEELRKAIPRLLLMTEVELQGFLKKNPTGVETLAARYIDEHLMATVDRFLGKTPNILTGKDGDPLIPEQKAPVLPPIDFSKWKPSQIDRFIENTKNR